MATIPEQMMIAQCERQEIAGKCGGAAIIGVVLGVLLFIFDWELLPGIPEATIILSAAAGVGLVGVCLFLRDF